MKLCLLLLAPLTACNLVAQETLDSKKFDAEGISRVEVKGSFVNIYADGTSGDKVTFDGKLEGPGRYQGTISIESELDGDVLKIWVERTRKSYNNMGGRFDLGIPDGTEVMISGSSGNINAKDISGREVSISCSSGNLKVSNLAGDISLKTSSGNISAYRLTGNVSVKASSGNVEIDNVEGDIYSKASSGRIRIENVKGGDVEVGVSSGNIYLGNVKGGVRANCSSGNIKGSDVLLTSDSRFETTSGTINVDLENNLNDISFDLRASSGNVSAGNQRGNKGRLTTNGGNIRVSARSSSGNINFD